MATSKYTPKDIVKFWSKVNKNGSIPKHRPELGPCWEWLAGLFSTGYGTFEHGEKGNHKPLKAHRVSWEIANDEIPNSLWVLHECDNRKCVNPNHLFLGTRTDNVRDMWAKGREYRVSMHGEKHFKHKMTDDKIKYIRGRFLIGDITKAELGREMGLDPTTIRDIIKRKTWRHVA